MRLARASFSPSKVSRYLSTHVSSSSCRATPRHELGVVVAALTGQCRQSTRFCSRGAEDTSPASPLFPVSKTNLTCSLPRHVQELDFSSNSYERNTVFELLEDRLDKKKNIPVLSRALALYPLVYPATPASSYSSLSSQQQSGHMDLISPQTFQQYRRMTDPMASAHAGLLSLRRDMRTPVIQSHAGRRLPGHSTEVVGYRAFTTGPPALYSVHAPPSPPTSSRSSTSSSPIDPVAAPLVSYRVACGGSGKTSSFKPERDIYGMQEYTRKKSRVEAGQDSYFIAPLGAMDMNTSGLAVGVADGVGGYMESGIDSADFSHEFCEHMARLATYAHPGQISPKGLMARGYNRVQDDGVVRGGASTACIGIARPDGRLDVANLGDSGYYVFRLGKVSFVSEPQTHAFNTPYQLSIVPPELLAQARAYGGVPLGDSPRSAHVTSHVLEPGDVIIFVTDGVSDNLYPHQILEIVHEEMTEARNWVKSSSGRLQWAEGLGDCVEKKIVERVVRLAKKMGADTRIDGPFAKEVHKYYPGEHYTGGKPDDVGVVCIVVEKGKL